MPLFQLAAAGVSKKTEARAERGETLRPKSAQRLIDALGGTREGFGGRLAGRS